MLMIVKISRKEECRAVEKDSILWHNRGIILFKVNYDISN